MPRGKRKFSSARPDAAGGKIEPLFLHPIPQYTEEPPDIEGERIISCFSVVLSC
jgi:hypothetical protein